MAVTPGYVAPTGRPSETAGETAPARSPVGPIARWSVLSSVLTGMNPRIASPSPMTKPQIATTT
jgi:hypothetical protein